MRKLLYTAAILATVIGFSVGGYTFAQDDATPAVDESLCVTPEASPGASPESSPVAVDMGTPADVQTGAGGVPPSPVVQYECPTPEGTPNG